MYISGRDIILDCFAASAIFACSATVGVTNGLSKMLCLGKFKPSLGISTLEKSVSESRISQKYDGLGVSDFENLDLGVSDFENVDREISPMGRSIFYPLFTRRSYNLPYLRLVPFVASLKTLFYFFFTFCHFQ